MERNWKVLGENVANLRLIMNMSQEEMASALGMGTTAYREFEKGKRDLSPRLRRKVLSMLNRVVDTNPEFNSDPEKKRIFLDSLFEEALNESTNSPPWLCYHEYAKKLWSLEPPLVCDAFAKSMTSAREDTATGTNLRGTVSSGLLAKFDYEKKARGLSASELLEQILTFYFQSQELLLATQGQKAQSIGPFASNPQKTVSDSSASVEEIGKGVEGS